METSSGKIVWVGRVISVLAPLLFIFSAFIKLTGGPELEQGMEHLGFPISLTKPLAILELSCVAIYLIPRTAVLGAVLLTGYLGGAICTHLRVGDPFWVQILLGLFIWLGIYLREDRLRDVLPLRRP
ncbi:MAG TPA: DoxX family protein [Blastocatellia bacterium]|nr:DoxX family protein [Blastocatellia bacterium]